MKFKFPALGNKIGHNCCDKNKAENCLSKPIVKIQCAEQSKCSQQLLSRKLVWEPIDMARRIVSSNTCFYNENAYHLDARHELTTWMLHVSYKLRYSARTYHLGVNLLDALLSCCVVELEHIKIVTYIALHLAAKMEESIDKVPSFASVAELFNYEFNEEQLKIAEVEMFTTLGYSLYRRTALVELEDMLQQGVVFCDEAQIYGQSINLENAFAWANQFLNRVEQEVLLSYNLTKYHPRVVAASLIFIARRTMGMDPWTERLARMTNIYIGNMEACITYLTDNHITYAQSHNNIIHSIDDEIFENEERLADESEDAHKDTKIVNKDSRKISRSSIYTTDGLPNFSPVSK